MIKIGNSVSNISVYTCQPKDKDELREIIEDHIYEEGPNCDLNDIDTSLITDMSYLFDDSYDDSYFNGDISRWNTSNVTDMTGMFYKAKFNGDISNWDVSNVKDVWGMFSYSKFTGDISKWNVCNAKNVCYMFIGCPIKEEHKPRKQ